MNSYWVVVDTRALHIREGGREGGRERRGGEMREGGGGNGVQEKDNDEG